MNDTSTETTEKHISNLRTIAPTVEKSNIIDQIATYNKNHTNIIINQLNEEYEQKEINLILKENFEENKKETESFVNKNGDLITEQLDFEKSLKISRKFGNENKELHEQQDEYKELNSSPEIQNLSEEKKLKLLKVEVITFLQENGFKHVIKKYLLDIISIIRVFYLFLSFKPQYNIFKLKIKTTCNSIYNFSVNF